jgi:hypothetical protein
MLPFTLLKRFFRNAARVSSRRSKPNRPRWDCYPLTLDRLEDRLVPAVTDLTTHLSYGTIQAAVSAANPGDTILADSGNYNETITINKSLTLEGAQVGVDARSGRLGAQESTLLLGNGGLQINADNVKVDGFTITNLTSSNANGLIYGGATSNNFILTNTIISDDNAPTGAPILFNGGSHTKMVFSQDLFQDSGDATLYLGGGSASDVYDGLNISNSKFLGSAGGVFYAAASPLQNARIQGNEFDGTVNGTPGVGDPVLNIGQSVNLTIAGNYFHDENYTAFQVGMIGGSITGNTFERIHADTGVGFGDDFQLWGGQYGTAVSTNVTIANNLISYNDVAGATLPTRGIRLRPQDSGSSAPGIDGSTIHVFDNAFVNGGDVSSGIFAMVNQGDPTKAVNASGNWWETALGADPTASTPFLDQISGLMSGPVHVGSFLNSGANTAAVGFTPAAGTEMWVPQTAATTGNTVVDGHIQDGINTAFSGMTVRVAADTYFESNIVVDKPVTILGQSETGAILAPAALDNHDPSTWGGTAQQGFIVAAANVTIENLTIDGNANSSLSGTQNFRQGIIADSDHGWTGTNGGGLTVDHVTLNNIFRKGIALYSRSSLTTGNSITNSTFNNVATSSINGFEAAFAIADFSSSGTISNNTITNSGGGIATNSVGGPAPTITVSNNQFSSPATGIGAGHPAVGLDLSNLAADSTVSGNVVKLTGGGSALGIVVQYAYGGLSVHDNSVTTDGGDTAFVLYEAPNSAAPAVLDHNSLTGTATDTGVLLTDDGTIFGDTPHSGTTFGTLTRNTITGFGTGVLVSSAGTTTVSAVVGSGTSISGGTTGILVSGANASLTFSGTNAASIFDLSGNYITLTNGADVGNTIDATGVTFDGHTGATATLAQNFAIEDKIQHAVDDAGLGFVRVMAGNVFVTPASGSIQRGVNAASSGDTLNVEAGLYVENVTVNKPVTLLGANSGVAGSSGGRKNAESVVRTSGNQTAIFTVGASGVTIDGFLLEGDDPNATGTTLASGADSNTLYGVHTSTPVSNLTVEDSIVRDVYVGVRGDGPTGSAVGGSLVTNDWFDSIGNFDFGYAVSLRTNFYADVTNNLMTRVWTGVHTNNFYQAGPATWSVAGNTIHSYAAGIWYNLQYQSATPLTMSGNQITAETGAVANNFGVLMVSIQDTVTPAFTNNTITGTDYGVALWNTATANVVTIGSSNSISGTKKAGVYLTNNLSFNPIGTTTFGVASAPTAVILDGVHISAADGADIELQGDPTGGVATLTVQNGVSVSGGATGLHVSGSKTAVAGASLTNTTFTGPTNYIVLENGALAGQQINATGTTFDGVAGATATLSQNYAIEDKISDFLDGGTVGYVKLNNGNVYVALSSELANAGAVQRGIDAAQAGDVVNLQAGTYVANGHYIVSGSTVGATGGQEVAELNINKPLTLVGPNANYDPNSGLTAANAQAIIVPGASDPNPYDPNAVIVMMISSSHVTVQGITVDGINPNLTHYSDPGTVSGYHGYVTAINNSAAPIDAAELIASYANVGNVTLENNLLQNAGYNAVDFKNGGTTATTGSVISRNLIQSVSDAYRYGDGVSLNNDFYADVTHNVIQNVRTGVQVGNYHLANPNANPTQFANVSYNTISADKIGLWYNLFYQSSSPFTFANNSISALSLNTNTKWSGVYIHSVQDTSSGTFQGNIIDGTNAYTSASVRSDGYDVWDTSTTGQLLISGGSVTGVDYGVWVNTYEGYSSSANNTQVTVNGLDITASQVGVWVEASPQNTKGATATATIDCTTIATGSGVGVKVSGASASTTVTDSTITGNATGIDVEGAHSLSARNNFITGNAGPALLVGSTGTPSVTVQDNDLSNNGSTVVQNSNSITVDAAENYWGPAYQTPAAVAGLVSGQVNFEPVLTAGNANPSAPGFQPDTTKLVVDISSGTTSPRPGAPYTLNLAPSNPAANNAAITQWVINWGDGTSITVSSPNIPAAVTHIYAQAGNYSITATATDELGNTANSNSVTVQGPAVSVQQGQSQVNSIESGDTNLVILARFTDPAGAGPFTDYSATVDWGDNSTPDNTADTNPNIFIVQAGNTFLVEGSHLYAEESPVGGWYTINTTIHRLFAPDASVNTLKAFVSDPAVSATAGPSFTVVEGQATGPKTLATFTDPAGPEAATEYTAIVNWGDGSSAEIITPTLSGGAFTVSGSHTYAEEGTYAVSVQIQHGTASTVTVTTSAVVADQAISLNTTPLTFDATEGSLSTIQAVATFTDPSGAENLTEYRATINWGDGTPVTTGTITFSNGTFTVLGSHTYGVMGSNPYQITVTVHHGTAPDAGGVTATAAVADVAPTITGTVPNQATTDRLAVTPFATVAIGDVDPNQQLTTMVTFAAANGVFTPASLTASGFTLVSGNGATAQYQFVGTASATTAALRQLVFQPTNYQVVPGQVVKTAFTMSVSDGILAPVLDASTSLIAMAAAGVDTLPFADSFDRPNAATLGGNWINEVGAFTISNDQALATGSLARLNGLYVTNSMSQVQLTLSPNTSNRAGLVTRYQGAGNANYYWAVIEGKGSTYYARIYLSVNGKLTLLTPNAKPLTLADGASKTGFSGALRLEANGSSLKLFVNGNLKAFTNNTSLLGDGSIGLQGWAGARFDNFLADNIGADQVASPFADQFTSVTNTNQLSYNWQQQAGAFTVAGGVASTVGTGLAFATLNNSTVTSANLQANVTLQNSAGSAAGLVACYNGNMAAKGSYYAAKIIANGRNSYTAEIVLYQNGVLKKVITKQTFKYTGTLSGTLNFSVSNGGVLTMSMGTLFILTGNNTTLTSGAVGMLGVKATITNFSSM